jgi:CheY-like chemotaxis protein
LILLDLNLPRLGGREVLAEVKNEDGLKTIPVAVLTTSTAIPDIPTSFSLQANAYVTNRSTLMSSRSDPQINRFYSDVAVLPG